MTKVLLAFLTLCLASAGLHADVLYLKNGDILSGKVTGRADGKVTLKGTLFGEVVVNESDIASFKLGESAAAPVDPAAAAAHEAAPVAVSTAPVASNVGSANPANFQGHASDPNKPVWSRSITFGGSYNSAPFEQGQIQGAPPGVTGAAVKLPGRIQGLQAALTLVRTTQNDAHSLEAAYNYTDFQPTGRQVDNYNAAFAWNHKLSERTYTMSRTSYSVDQIKHVDYSAVQLLGFGYKVVNTQKTKFDVVPGIVVQKEKKGNRWDGDVQFGAGFMESFYYFFNQAAMFEHRLLYRQSIEESDIYALDAYAGFKGMLNPVLGLSVGVTYLYDNTLGPIPGYPPTVIAQKKDTLQLTSGIQIKF